MAMPDIDGCLVGGIYAYKILSIYMYVSVFMYIYFNLS